MNQNEAAELAVAICGYYDAMAAGFIIKIQAGEGSQSVNEVPCAG